MIRRILFVISDLGGGGAERVVVELLRELDRSRFRPFLALAVREGPYLADVPADVPILDLGGAGAFRRGQLFRLVRRLRALVAEHEIDLLASTTILPNTALSRARLLASDLPPLVLLQQDNLSAETRMRATGLKRWLLHTELRGIFRLPHHIVCASAGLRDDLVSAFDLRDDRLSVVRNGLPLARIREQAKGSVTLPWVMTPGEKLIVTAGRLVPQKGYPDLLQAFAALRRDTAARLVILGEGRLESELRQLTQSLGIAEAVAFIGFKENPWAWMARADLFVLASHHEGLGNVLVEAMACGAAVLSTDCPHGPGEVIVDGETGRLVPVGDIEALTGSMRDLLCDNAVRARLVEQAASRVEAFDSSRMVSSYERLFLQTLPATAEAEFTEARV